MNEIIALQKRVEALENSVGNIPFDPSKPFRYETVRFEFTNQTAGAVVKSETFSPPQEFDKILGFCGWKDGNTFTAYPFEVEIKNRHGQRYPHLPFSYLEGFNASRIMPGLGADNLWPLNISTGSDLMVSARTIQALSQDFSFQIQFLLQ